MTDDDAKNILMGALAKIASKEHVRDGLVDGAHHAVEVSISGEVDGQPVRLGVDASLTVGHGRTGSSSSTPNQTHLLALLLGMMNAATRAKVCRELPEKFAQRGELPSVGDLRLAQAKDLLERLRAKKTTDVRGVVSCPYTLTQ